MTICGEQLSTVESTAITVQIAERFLSSAPIGDMLLISDYGKGVLTKGLRSALVGRARNAGVPILVDPARSRCWSDYGQVTLVKANWAEATEAAGMHNARPLTLARSLADHYCCHVVVTLGGDGMVCAEREGQTWHTPAKPADILDVCGAGDTALAGFGAALAAGYSPQQAGRLASRAATRQIESIGITAPFPFDAACPLHS